MKLGVLGVAVAVVACGDNLEVASKDGGSGDQPPTVSDQQLTTMEDTPLTGSTGAADPDGDTLTITFSTPAHGTVSGSDGAFTYVPEPNYAGPDQIAVTVSDGTGEASATISITVTPVNDGPTAVADSLTTPEDTPLVIVPATLTTNDTDIDGDPLVITAVASAQNGVVTLDSSGVTFTPDLDFNGIASFQYTVNDGGLVATEVVMITVTAVNDPPIASDDSGFSAGLAALDIPVATLLANDFDPDSTMTVIGVTNATGGTVALDAGMVTFTATPGFNGTATFEYTVSDGSLTDVAMVSITIDGDPPGLTIGLGGPACTTGVGASLSAASGGVTINASDAGPYMLRCDLVVNGSLWVSYVCASNAVGCNCTNSAGFQFSGVPDGSNNVLTVTATDAAANDTVNALTWITDAAAPSITFVSPPGSPPFPGVVPLFGVDGAGTFTVGPDPADTPVTVACDIDGQAQACTSTTYTIPATLAEGNHTVSIAATDCIGNTSPSTQLFTVDAQPPAQVFPPIVSVTGSSAVITLNLLDTTNIQTIECAIDADSLISSFSPCGATGLPTPVPAYGGTITLTDLAPGLHRTLLRATDYWGHTSVYQVSFRVSYGGKGHVTLIGEDLGTPDGNIGRIVGNAAATASAAVFARPVHILLFDAGLAGSAAGNVISSIDTRFGELSLSPASYGLVDAATPIGDALLGQDVLVILDQNDAAFSQAQSQSAAWNAELRSFAEDGGVIIVLDGLDPIAPSETWRLISGPGQPLIRILDAAPFVSGQADLMCNSGNLDALGVVAPFAIANGVTYMNAVNLGGSWVFGGTTTCPSGSGQCTRGLVIDTPVPLDPNVGPLLVTAYDEGTPRDATAHALFSASDGSTITSCPLMPGGVVMHDVGIDASVTITSPSGTQLQTLLGIGPYRSVAVGRTQDRITVTTLDVTPPSFLGAADYTISNGCSTVRIPGGVVTLPVHPGCLAGANVEAIAVANDVNGIPLAWARAAVACNPGPCALIGFDFGPWQGPPFQVAVGLLGPIPAGTISVERGFATSLDSIMHDQPGPVPVFWAPRPPDAFATSVRATATFNFAPDVLGRERSTLLADQGPAPFASATINLDVNASLAETFDLFAVPCAPDHACAQFVTGAGPVPVTSADLSMLVVNYLGDCVLPVSWEVVSPPPPAPSGSITTPTLPLGPAFDCAHGMSNLSLTSLGFYETSALTPPEAALNAWDVVDQIDGRSRMTEQPIGTAVRASRIGP